MDSDASHRQAALTRAVMRIKPEYFSWPVEQQEKYRAAMPDEDYFQIRRSFLEDVFDIDASTKDAVIDAIQGLDLKQCLVLNSAMLPIMGIGEDYFWLNEVLGQKTILDFENLYAYDYDDHCFQEQTRKEDFPGYEPRPYRGSLFHIWARLQIDGQFHYATLSMAASHILNVLEEASDELIEDLIPYKFVAGRDHGKRHGKGTLYDMRYDAGGKELQLEELKDRVRQHLTERYYALQEEFDCSAYTEVYLIDRSRKYEPAFNVVFSDKTALQNVRFRHFMKDCRALLSRTEPPALHEVAERERRALTDFLQANYHDVMNNFDPAVVKLRRQALDRFADAALDPFPGLGTVQRYRPLQPKLNENDMVNAGHVRPLRERQSCYGDAPLKPWRSAAIEAVRPSAPPGRNAGWLPPRGYRLSWHRKPSLSLQTSPQANLYADSA